MKLRSILMILSLLTVLSASTGGYLYYSSLKEAAFNEAEKNAVTRVEMIRRNISSFLLENTRPAEVLAGLEEIKEVLIKPDSKSFKEAYAILDHFNESLNVSVCYILNQAGDCIASSNRNDPDSFEDKNYSFRPYYQEAIKGMPSTYLALGTVSELRGVYSSHPVYKEGQKEPVGIVVIKALIELIEKQLEPSYDDIVLVTDPNNLIFISNRKDWLYKFLWKPSGDITAKISTSRQFGKGPWPWTGLTPKSRKSAVDQSGNKYQAHYATIDNFPGWQVVHLHNFQTISKTVFGPLIRITGPIMLMCILIGLLVFFLYQIASREIKQRKKMEKALRDNEEMFRSLYHKTPAMLHSVDTDGRLISVSDYWIEVLGYDREEVIGQKISRFFTKDSRQYAEEVVFPQFFDSGFCKDIPYQFVKKNGIIIDTLLSAVSIRDEKGAIKQSLAVSIDVTERKKAEEALRLAKEELRLYSKDLERQVRKRTSEITSILKYTPAVVYIKDKQGHYILINSRYEELFGVKNEEVKGISDYEIHSKKVADQLRANDLLVLSEKRFLQTEESIPVNGVTHTYLSVKFPIYDESDEISGLCGISTDITALKKAQDQLRRLSGNIMSNQEKERSAIARELHDELGQELTALRMDSVWFLERLQKADPDAGKRAKEMCKLIDKTIDDVRNIAIRLRPGVLDDLGLVDALEWCTSDFERRTGISSVFKHSKFIPDINNNIATAAYRIVQEALTNIARHSLANQVDVSLRAWDNILSLTIKDDGRGFNTMDLSESEGLGVAGMRERAVLVGGMLNIQSQSDNGTKVIFNVPIDDNGGKTQRLHAY